MSEGQALMAQQSRQAITAAIAKFKEAFALCQKNDSKEGMAGARFLEGVAYDSLGKQREALSAFIDASRYAEQSWLALMKPILQAATGAAYASLGETDKALESLNAALPMLRSANIAQFTAYALKGLGEVNVRIGQKQKALEYLTESRDIYRRIADWRHEIHVLVLVSLLRSSLGQSTEALESASAAVQLSREKNAADSEAYAHLAFAAAYAAVGNLERAATEYKQTLKVFQAQDDRSGEATSLNNLGLIYVARGEFDLALDHFKRSLALYESTGEPEFAAYASNNIATIYSRRGDPVAAFLHFEKALSFATQHKDRRLEATVLTSLADTYFLINSPNYSLRLLKEEAAAFSAIEEPARESEALISLADGYTALGRYQDALDVLRPALESRRKAEDRSRQGYILREMGYVYTLAGNRSEALKHFAEALSLLETTGDVIGKVDLFAAIASVYLSNGDYQKAEELYNKVLGLAQTIELRQLQPLILSSLGLLHERRGNLTQAESSYEQGVAIIESLRSSARIEELKTVVGSLSAKLFSSVILLKFKLGKWSEAFELAERARARTFLDQMNGVRIDVRKGSDPQLIEQEQSLRFDIHSLEEKLRTERRNNPSSEAVALMAAALKEKEEAYTALMIRLKASNPEYAALQSYLPRSLIQIQTLLGPQTTLVSYFVTPEKTLAFVVGSDSFQAVEIPVNETELRAAINWFRGFPDLRDPEPQSLRQLDAWLIAPIRKYIKTAEVVIVPHGILHYLPFAALTDGRQRFGEEHAIYYLPSASILPSIQSRVRPFGNRVLAAAQSRADGLPELRYADKEAVSVAKLYRTQPLPTGRATRSEFLKRANACDVLHIAAHAQLNASSPLFSRILLSPDKDDGGAIEVREVYGMDLARTSLVVLSACETQLGAQSKGDDVVGLNRAFIYAGTPTVIASLWTVDDESTSLLMKSFYGHLKQGMSKASALQAAQSEIRRKYPHPYYWAAFVLTGDPGKNTNDKDSLWRLPGLVVPPSGGHTSLRVGLRPEGGATNH